MRILILGGDGYLGWPTAMHFSARDHDVAVVDNFLRRRAHLELGSNSLTPIRSLHERAQAWQEVSGRVIEIEVGDLNDYAFLSRVVTGFAPDAIVHYGEQPSAPYSMIDRDHAVLTQQNNVLGTLNVLFAIRDLAPRCHLVKLGTMTIHSIIPCIYCNILYFYGRLQFQLNLFTGFNLCKIFGYFNILNQFVILVK